MGGDSDLLFDGLTPIDSHCIGSKGRWQQVGSKIEKTPVKGKIKSCQTYFINPFTRECFVFKSPGKVLFIRTSP